MNKDVLINHFKQAKESNSPYVFIGVSAEGVREVICIPRESFDEKLEFYKRSYTYDLTHVMNKRVFITNFAYGDSDTLNNLFT